MKRKCVGLTLLEILLSLAIVAAILAYLIPQELRTSHEALVDKTVAQMNQLVLAARNYYQDNRLKVLSNAAAWPTTVKQLTTSNYLPPAALCSSWPKEPASQQSPANNQGNDCGGHQEYALFPANSSGTYDTTVPGIAINGTNSGGNFWGVSLALPNNAIAEEVRQRLPFGTTCPPSDLSQTTTACGTSSNIVTAIAPRPGQWPGGASNQVYSKDGLIQSMGSIVVCDNSSSTSSFHCSNNRNTVTIPPSSVTINCGKDENGNTLVPQLFVYPLSYQWPVKNNHHSNSLPGVQVLVNSNSSPWTVQVGASNNKDPNTNNFTYISLGYFIVCQPANSPTGDWTLPNYRNKS